MSDERHDRVAFEAHLAQTKVVVDRALGEFLETELSLVSGVRDDLAQAIGGVQELSLRGGKRFRAALSAAAYMGYGGKDWADCAGCVPALVALELLQVYLLIHDDWMDGDEIRRGGKSVPAMMRERYGAKQADAWSILAGDYACALAQKALAGAEPANMAGALACFADMQRDVVLGQMLDVAPLEAWGTRSGDAGPADLSPIETVYRLKTGAYTVRGPLSLGAILAGASAERVERLTRFADALGVAFQLTDDLLSTFGTKDTGKPAYGDLREGKLTWLAMNAMNDPGVRSAMPGTFGAKDASDVKLASLARAIESSGARAKSVARAQELAAEARASLPSLELPSPITQLLSGAIVALTERAS